MLSSLLTSLTSLRDFLSRAFFIAAFIPTLLFVFTNALILFLWSWPVHNWIMKQLLEESAIYKTILFAILFLGLWIYSYVVAALTPIGTRTLEGKNWWAWIRGPGVEFHTTRYTEISNRIEKAVKIYVSIAENHPTWNTSIANAKAVTKGAPNPEQPPGTPQLVDTLQALKNADKLIEFAQIEALVTGLADDIKTNGYTDSLNLLAGNVTQLITYGYDRARAEHSRSLNERNAEFGDQEEIAPTRFGNVGLSAQAYAMRAYHCNITLIWSALRRAIEKNESTAKALEGCKSQLDFFVASFWLTLGLAVAWALV